jgi:4-hydroxybenzoate polyprenyltransferase
MNRLKAYLRERFPLAPTSAHALATAALLVGIASNSSDQGRHWAALGIAMSFLFFMLRMRVTDEFKDATHDNANYPNRPVQRGAIYKRDLVSIGIVSLILELLGVAIAANAAGNLSNAVWYLPILIYSVLTGREFFIGEYLDRHFNLYFLLHQAIFVFWIMWGFAMFSTSLDGAHLGAAVGFFVLMISMEVVRKYEIRKNAGGEIVRDTYLVVWGTWAFWVLVVNLLISAIAFYLLSDSWPTLLVAALSLFGLLLLRKIPEAVRAVAAVSFLITSAVVFFK